MSKFSRIIVIFAALLAGAVTSFAADKPCDNLTVEKCTEYVANTREAAEQGDAEAQYQLARVYYHEQGVAKNYRKVVRWLRKAAEQKHAKAQFNLGWMYFKGEEVAMDKREAVRLFRLAAEQGYAIAQNNLGKMYFKGENVAKDNREALRWYRLAAEQGYAKAQYNLGVMYEKGYDVEKNKGEALRLYLLAAEQGYAWAQNNLGVMYEKGEGVVKDNRKAVRWYRLAAEQGNEWAQNKLGVMHQNGDGVVKDNREAVRWYRLAAEQGDAWAQNNLGQMYYYGSGVVKDERKAYIWYLIAKAGGNETAGENFLKNPWQQYLTSTEIKSAKREAARRFDAIENRKNSAHSLDDNLAKKGGEEFAVAKPPEQTNIAAAVFENTWRSVVMIKNNTGQGSGVIIRPNLVATNCHVIEGGGVFVYKPENRRINESTPFSAKVVHRKEEHDFCILEVKGLWGIAATIRKYDTLKIGENVYALGAPSGLDLSLSNGLVSQLRTKKGTRFIQTDAAISPGSSGGGLFDTKGNFIGILTSKYVGEDVEGIGFAIPADLVLGF